MKSPAEFEQEKTFPLAIYKEFYKKELNRQSQQRHRMRQAIKMKMLEESVEELEKEKKYIEEKIEAAIKTCTQLQKKLLLEITNKDEALITTQILAKRISPVISNISLKIAGFKSNSVLGYPNIDHLSPEIGNQCPGCGAIFQLEDEKKPGFLVTTISSLQPEKKAPVPRRKDQDQFDYVVSKLDEETRKLLYPLSYNKEFERYEDFTISKKKTQNNRIFCKRCYDLMHQNRLPTSDWQEDYSDTSFLKFLSKKQNSIVITVVDIFDFPGSLLNSLERLIGERTKHILVANKIDLLPKDIHYDRIQKWVYENAKRYGLHNLKKVHLVSAKKDHGVKELVARIAQMRGIKDDIYLVGCTNVGKSELMNSFLRTSARGGWQYKVTASLVPGTTIGMLGLPLSIFEGTFGGSIPGRVHLDDYHYLYDTPGIVNRSHLLRLLTHEELQLTIPTSSVRPLSYRIIPGKSIFFGGLGRIDFLRGDEPIIFTIFSKIPIHITNIERANQFCQNLQDGWQQDVIVPPIGPPTRIISFPPIIVAKKSVFVKGMHGGIAVKDIVFSGVGWASISGYFNNAELRVYSPNGEGVFIRDHPLLPYEFKGKVGKNLINKVLVKQRNDKEVIVQAVKPLKQPST
ncbi:hypothetical protein G9A89_015243 [Geosiphon pyriformis]|nr:hypothetical protein G9A89_015243 [Geosiphon pyriformis]